MRRILLLVVPAAGLLGCVPDTPYRYTALTPAARPIPWEGRGSRGGTLHLEGHASNTGTGVDLIPKSPALHATALHVTRVSLDGAISLEPVRGAQIGLHATYSAYDWSHESTIGTMPMPGKTPLFGVGPDLRVWIPFDRRERFALGIAGRATFYRVPFAEWTREHCTPSPGCVETTADTGGAHDVTYRLTREDTETKVVLTGGLYPSVGLGDRARYGSVFALVGITQGFSNDGFTDVRSSDGKIALYAVPLVGGGYGFRTRWFHVGTGFFVPISSSPVSYGPGAWISLGLDLPLWRGETSIGQWAD